VRRAAALLLLALVVARPAAAAPHVEASLSAGSVEAGDGVTLVVVVTDPGGQVSDPNFALPRGLSILGSEQGQSFSLVNGHASSRIEYRYAIGTAEPGTYTVGPVTVRVGRTELEVPAMSLTVTTPAPRDLTPGRSAAGASLVVEVRPQRPYVGQLVQLSMRLVQTQNLVESGGNSTPSTTGFWAENWGDPIESHASVRGRPAIVTERRSRIYPLAPGPASIGSAAMIVTPGPSGGADPFFGGAPAQPVEIRSDPVKVDIRPLPGGAPRGFDNGVGTFAWSWGLDRGHAAQDQALTLRLDVRGSGNLPLLHTPPLAPPDFEVYASTVDDSFPPAGDVSPGRRRFLWTLMPRRSGTLSLRAPEIAWFDPEAGAYRTASLEPLEVEVLAAGSSRAGDTDTAFPEALAREPAHPGGRAALPWLYAIAGVLAGLAVRAWRGRRGSDPLAGERAHMRELLRGVGLARGPDFWSAADEAVSWVESRGGQVLRLREDIAAARYSGQAVPEDDVRRRLVERISASLPAEPARVPAGLVTAGLGGAAALALVLGFGTPGRGFAADRSRQADELARSGRLEEAGQVWQELWRAGGADGALLARLAWAELRLERPASASAWILEGRSAEPRSGALGWVTARVRESGGLVGSPGARVPLRSIEWAALAFALTLGALLEWPRRWSAGVLLALGLAAAIVPLAERLGQPRGAWAVVASQVTLPGTDVELEPGQVVRVLGEAPGGRRVRAARELEGVLPDSLLLRPGQPR
jgi:hypothetical protein